MILLAAFAAYLGYGKVLSQKDLDQGDTAQRVGLFYSLAGMMGEERNYRGDELKKGLSDDLSALSGGSGLYRRSPDPSFWGYRTNNLSRDQHAMLMMAMAVNGFQLKLEETFESIISRFGFYQNVHPGTDAPLDYRKIPDFLNPHDISRYLRGVGAWWLYPVITIIDACYLVDLALREQAWDYDNMLAVNLMYANVKYPTFFSVLSWQLYQRTDFISKIKNYYREDGNNGLKPLGELYEECYHFLRRKNWWMR